MKKYLIDLPTDRMKQMRNSIRAFRRNYNLSGDTVRILKWNKGLGRLVIRFGGADFEVDVENLHAIELQLLLHLHQYRINQHTRRINYE